MAASTVGRIHTHTSAQCSPASVGLAQARPNDIICETVPDSSLLLFFILQALKAWDVKVIHLPVTPLQLMRPGID